jgi:hypothetical protein
MPTVRWLRETEDGPWLALSNCLRKDLPVPNGFVVEPEAPEREVRDAYEILKQTERTHYVALRSPSHALLDVLGNDAVVHALRRLWTEASDAPILIQRMIHSEWCGKATRQEKNRLIRIKANEGMLILDPDSYVFNSATGKCTRRGLQKTQRKLVRSVDGAPQSLESHNRRSALDIDQLKRIAELTESAQASITWALDDRQIWLISVTRS